MIEEPAPERLPIPGADPKPWYQSRTVVGALATVAASTAGLFGVGVDAGVLTELALQSVSLVGGLVALWGRVRAAQPIAPQLLPRI